MTFKLKTIRRLNIIVDEHKARFKKRRFRDWQELFFEIIELLDYEVEENQLNLIEDVNRLLHCYALLKQFRSINTEWPLPEFSEVLQYFNL